MFYSVTQYLAVFFVFGFLPIYLALCRFNFKKSLILIISFGFAPVSVAAFNVFSVIFSIQHNQYVTFLIAALCNIVILYFPSKNRIYSKGAVLSLRGCSSAILIGFILGVFYWWYTFYPYTLSSEIYNDTLFNFSIISELRNHFLPANSRWYSSEVSIYHFLMDIYFAGMVNFSGVNILQTVNIGNFVHVVSIFLIIALSAKQSKFKHCLIFASLLFIQFSYQWGPFSTFNVHMSGKAASTFFWSFPLLLTTVYFWLHVYEKKRRAICLLDYGYLKLILLAIVLTFCCFFAKVTIMPIIGGLELYAFIRFVLSHSLFSFKKIKCEIKLLSTYLFIPFFILLWAVLMAVINGNRASGGLSLGLEIMDFQVFDSWSLLYPILAMYGVVAGIVLLNISDLKHFKMELLFASLLNFVLFFIVKHIGSSDLYFAFNCIICNALFVIYSDVNRKGRKVALSILGMCIVVIFLNSFTNIKGFSLPNNISWKSGVNWQSNARDIVYGLMPKAKRVSGPEIYENGEVKQNIQDMIDLSNELPIDSLIAVEGFNDTKHFTYAAFIGRRFWNESGVYTPSTLTVYSHRDEFQKQQRFFPVFFGSKPIQKNEDDAQVIFQEKESKNYEKLYEDTFKRTAIFNDTVFQNIGQLNSEAIAIRYGWTHILIKSSSLDKINDWLEGKEKITKNDFTVFIL